MGARRTILRITALTAPLAAAAMFAAPGQALPPHPFGPPARAEPHILRRLLDDALEIEVSRKKVEGRAS